MGRTVMPGNCALMGATRLASGIFQQPRPASVFSAASGRVAPISARIFAVRFRQLSPKRSL